MSGDHYTREDQHTPRGSFRKGRRDSTYASPDSRAASSSSSSKRGTPRAFPHQQAPPAPWEDSYDDGASSHDSRWHSLGADYTAIATESRDKPRELPEHHRDNPQPPLHHWDSYQSNDGFMQHPQSYTHPNTNASTSSLAAAVGGAYSHNPAPITISPPYIHNINDVTGYSAFNDSFNQDSLTRGFTEMSLTASNPIPRPASSGTRRESKVADAEQLDSRYVHIKEGNRFFKVGRVFKCLWTEPAGSVIGDGNSHVTAVKYGEKVFSKVRYFVVVREQKGCCQCVPMNTFGRQGLTKGGIDLRDYAAVSAEGVNVKYQPGERSQVMKRPLSIKVEVKGEKIDPNSRINFSRVYTVEHNIKVMKVGRISDNNLKDFRRYFRESFIDKEADSEDAIRRSPDEQTPSQVLSGVGGVGEYADLSIGVGDAIAPTSGYNHIRITPTPAPHFFGQYLPRHVESPNIIAPGPSSQYGVSSSHYTSDPTTELGEHPPSSYNSYSPQDQLEVHSTSNYGGYSAPAAKERQDQYMGSSTRNYASGGYGPTVGTEPDQYEKRKTYYAPGGYNSQQTESYHQPDALYSSEPAYSTSSTWPSDRSDHFEREEQGDVDSPSFKEKKALHSHRRDSRTNGRKRETRHRR